MEKGGCERNARVAFSYAVPRAVGDKAGLLLPPFPVKVIVTSVSSISPTGQVHTRSRHAINAPTFKSPCMEKGGCERNARVAFSYAVPRAVGDKAQRQVDLATSSSPLSPSR
jgi:hypothetical protein